MVAKFMSKLNPVLFYSFLMVIFMAGCIITNYIIIVVLNLEIPFPTTLPGGLVVLPFVLSRIKTNPEEFAHIPKKNLRLIFFSFLMGSIMEVAVKLILTNQY